MKVNEAKCCIEADQLDRFWSKVDRSPGQGPCGECWEWAGGEKNQEGYGGFYLRQINNTVNAHKLSFLLAHNFGLNDIPSGIVVRHKCNNPKCARPEHLALGTHKDNSQDMVAAGNSVRGPRNSLAKLTWEQVNGMREMWSTGEHSYGHLGRVFGLSACQVRVICRNESWRDPNYVPKTFPDINIRRGDQRKEVGCE
jgi:hypothetical protein